MNHIMFICHGNICRSLMGECILKDMVKARGVADPWYTDRFDVAYADIVEGCEALLNEICRGT